MCNVYTGTPQERYESDCRSIRIQGCVTSIRLETEFWEILDQMADEEDQTVPQFINVLYGEILEKHEDVSNFTSFLRVACAIYLHRKGEVVQALAS
ncbi:MAG: DNA-binding protein [Gammaproteobacteria bacterium]|nr:MAG: DNA-binding protein [Gammaproteobacteria bacterium]